MRPRRQTVTDSADSVQRPRWCVCNQVPDPSHLPAKHPGLQALRHRHSQPLLSVRRVETCLGRQLEQKDISPGGEEAKDRTGGQNAKPTDQVASHSDSGERRRHRRRTRRGNRSRTDSDRDGGIHESGGNHHLNDTPGGASNCYCQPDLEGTATPRLLTPTGRVSPEQRTPPRGRALIA